MLQGLQDFTRDLVIEKLAPSYVGRALLSERGMWTTLIGYATFVLTMTPRMKNRGLKQYIDPHVKVVWNSLMFVVSVWICLVACLPLAHNLANMKERSITSKLYTMMVCDGDYELSAQNLHYAYLFSYFSKYIEFGDSLLNFVIPGRTQINARSVLHVWHHFITPAIVFYGMARPMSPQWLSLVLNAVVHIFMYAYFALATVSTSVRKYGQFIFTIQMSQFVLNILHMWLSTWGIVMQGCTYAERGRYLKVSLSDSEICYFHYFGFVSFIFIFWMMWQERKERRRRKEAATRKKVEEESCCVPDNKTMWAKELTSVGADGVPGANGEKQNQGSHR